MSDVLCEIADGIATVTLNRPERHNAYTLKLSAALSDIMRACDADDAVRVVVVTGNGESFCVGLDLGEVANADRPTAAPPVFSRKTYPFEISKPVIAAINGRAGGFGIAYPLACDIRVVDEDATIAFSFVRNGLLPEMAATALLARLVGIEVAAELLLTGKKFTGREAHALGLVAHAVPKDQVLRTALDIAADIARNCSPIATALTKRLLWDRQDTGRPLADLIVEDRDLFMEVMRGADGIEGARAFLEKRQPDWRGSVSRDVPALYAAHKARAAR